MSKFQVGQRVYLFNSISLQIESDDVYGVLKVPVAVEDVEQDSGKSIAEKIASGQMEVREQYQLCQHQGILDAECLFESEDGCKEFFREFFSK